MKINIRPYNKSDFKMISQWWADSKELGPLEGMLMEDGTFVLEVNDLPAFSITVYLTQSKEMAYLENFIVNPNLSAGPVRKELSQIIVNHAYKYAKDKGYNRVICLAHIDKLKKRYEELGMTKTLDNLSSFVREL